MTPDKLLAFLTHESQRLKRGGGKLAYNSLRGAINAVINLWHHQEFHPVVIDGVEVEYCRDNPRSTAVATLLRTVEIRSRAGRKGSLEHTVADGSYSLNPLSTHEMGKALFVKSTPIGDRTRMDVATARASVCRGNEVS